MYLKDTEVSACLDERTSTWRIRPHLYPVRIEDQLGGVWRK